MDDEKIIEQLFLIMTELDARHSSCNAYSSCNALSILTWNELCDVGIDLFNKLKQTKG